MKTDQMTVLIAGSGGREHALYDAIRKSPRVRRVFVAPGNAGIPKERRVSVRGDDVAGLLAAATRIEADFVIPANDAAVAGGLADACERAGIAALGPSKTAAKLEWSKIYAKTRCKRWGIPTAPFDFAADYGFMRQQIFKLNPDGARITRRGEPCTFRVVKADGLCAGKGALVCDTLEETLAAAESLLVHKRLGRAGERIVVEDKLEGVECSVFALCDGERAEHLAFARDYKRLSAEPKAPNTGGMGAYAPVPDVDAAMRAPIYERIVNPLMREMKACGRPYHGILYAGLMLTKDGPVVLEFNCRFGDPEAQVILPLLDCDLVDYLLACTETGGLAKLPPPRVKDACTVAVVMAAAGYPDSPATGVPVCLDGAVHDPERGMLVFHAGTECRDGRIVTAGGRVLNSVGIGSTHAEARERAYRNLASCVLPGGLYRGDIAQGL